MEKKVKLIVVRGEQSQGKTSTIGLTYRALLQKEETARKHIFNKETVETDSLKYNTEGNMMDFTAILTVKGLKAGIISSGDYAPYVKGELQYLIAENVVVIICAARSINREGSTYRMLKEHPACEIADEDIWPYKDTQKSIEEVKKPFVNQIIDKLFELLND